MDSAVCHGFCCVANGCTVIGVLLSDRFVLLDDPVWILQLHLHLLLV
jgi:hypothetical protein